MNAVFNILGFVPANYFWVQRRGGCCDPSVAIAALWLSASGF
jgi:hypothetical protein